VDKSELIDSIVESLDQSPQAVRRVINEFLATVAATLADGEQVDLGEFGTFERRRKSVRFAAGNGLGKYLAGAGGSTRSSSKGSPTQKSSSRDSTSQSSSSGSPGTKLDNRTLDELRKLAADRDVEGRSSMSKGELISALRQRS
jgi:nucleoid DNA-binding protein